MSSDSPTAGEQFDRLVSIMAQLRSPGGCPWDREQTFDTIKPYLLEETYEVMEAIDARDWKGLTGELGDLLLQPVFFAQMASEAGLFRIEDALESINAKLIRRHPHIFGDVIAQTPEDVKRNWDRIKQEEKAGEGISSTSILDSASRVAPALMEAQAMTQKAAGVGFDWENAGQVIHKLHEELAELQDAKASGDAAAVASEVGDLIFVLVNLARKLGVDAEQALRGTNAKFRRRFAYVEHQLAAHGKTPVESSLEEMDLLWSEAKLGETSAK